MFDQLRTLRSLRSLIKSLNIFYFKLNPPQTVNIALAAHTASVDRQASQRIENITQCSSWMQFSWRWFSSNDIN